MGKKEKMGGREKGVRATAGKKVKREWLYSNLTGTKIS
jgi:hypothetical protein